MKKILLLSIITLVLSLTALAQDTTRVDSAASPMRIDINTSAFALRLSTGMQRNYFIELGLAHTSFIGSPHGIYGFEYFGTVSYFPSFKKNGDQSIGGKSRHQFFWQRNDEGLRCCLLSKS